MDGNKRDLLNCRQEKKGSLDCWQSTYFWGLTLRLPNTNNLCRGVVVMHAPPAKLYACERNSYFPYSVVDV